MTAFASATPFPHSPSQSLRKPLLSSRGRPIKWHISHSTRASLQPPPDANALLEKLKGGVQHTQMLALVLLPQLPSKQAVSLLYESGVLDSENRQVRLTAVATLGKLGVPHEANRLVTVLKDDSDDYSVRAAAANALGYLLPGSGDGSGLVGEALSALVDVATGDDHFILKYAAIVTIGNLGDKSAMDTLIPIAQNPASLPLEAAAAVTAIGEISAVDMVEASVVDVVISRAADREDLVRAAVAKTLKLWVTVERAASALARMKTDEEKYGQSDFVRAILNIAD
ncbi:unnamed protein product [Chondrus crispus]|uniref:Uncharacterized protein n=1 Tax=Chondrus crispus TaxID=2769 RepID=R7QDZ2_CHOCR|nr:unnamed protein product [Chondrus crispus]CDF35645.1 unnamed protein product [Chondrus crispus]|eukprot:XP_005715464.1 unnamed protein product [Chondrus crispus]